MSKTFPYGRRVRQAYRNISHAQCKWLQQTTGSKITCKLHIKPISKTELKISKANAILGLLEKVIAFGMAWIKIDTH